MRTLLVIIGALVVLLRCCALAPAQTAPRASTWYQSNVTTHAVANTATNLTRSSVPCRTALLNNTGLDSVSVGPNTNASFYAIPAGTMFQIPWTDFQKVELTNWFIKSATATQTVSIIYLSP